MFSMCFLDENSKGYDLGLILKLEPHRVPGRSSISGLKLHGFCVKGRGVFFSWPKTSKTVGHSWPITGVRNTSTCEL